MTRAEYFSNNHVSNSDLSWLEEQLTPSKSIDTTNAFRLGTLIDAMLTENKSNIDYYQRTCHNEKYTKEEFDLSYKMKNSFLRDRFCKDLLLLEPQCPILKNTELSFNGINFNMELRCLYDLKSNDGWGCDIKSTTAKTQSEFESAFLHFKYHRQRAFYMDISDSDLDIVIGISKSNFKIFKVYIKKGSDIYNQGRDEYTHLCFRWNLLFGRNKDKLIR